MLQANIPDIYRINSVKLFKLENMKLTQVVFLGRVLIVSKHDSLFLATGDIALYSCFYKIPLISSFLFMREDGKYYFQYNTDQLNIIISMRRLKINHWIDSKHKLNKNGTFSITSFISDLSVSLWILYISRAKSTEHVCTKPDSQQPHIKPTSNIIVPPVRDGEPTSDHMIQAKLVSDV